MTPLAKLLVLHLLLSTPLRLAMLLVLHLLLMTTLATLLVLHLLLMVLHLLLRTRLAKLLVLHLLLITPVLTTMQMMARRKKRTGFMQRALRRTVSCTQ